MNNKPLICVILLGTCASLLNANSKPLKNSRPNFIFVITDDQGMGDLSCMGNTILRTPNIDRFYEESTRFTDFQVSPTSAPTRSAIMSGREPFKNGVTHTILQRERMALDVFTLPQALQTTGYKTGIFGKWHLGDADEYLPGNRGFDEVLIHGSGGIGQINSGDFPTNDQNLYFDNVLLHNDTIVKTKGFCTDIFFQSALSWIKKQHDSKHPYFAYISLNAPHGPFNKDNAPKKYQKRFLDEGYDNNTAVRYGMIENIDDNFGILMAKLKEWDALTNTIIIFMTDNGMSMPFITRNEEKIVPYNAGLKGRKNSPYEGGTHVPFFIQWKGVLRSGIDIDVLVAHIDLYKTFCDLAGVKLPAKMQKIDGRSFLPLLENPQAEWPDRELFIHCGRWNNGERDLAKYQKCAVRTEQWRFVNNSELSDVTIDPGETKNVAASNHEILEQLRKDYDKWWESVLSFMVNENLPEIKQEQQPLSIRYHKQLKDYGIPEWNPESINN